MPAKGSRKVPKEEKAQIIAEKRLNSATDVALIHGIARNTVYTIEAKASPELIALADEYHKNITEQAKLNVLAGLRTMHGKMADPHTSLKDLTPAVKVNHDILQLRTGQPTSITENADTRAELLRDFLRAKWPEYDDSEIARAMLDQDWGVSLESRKRVAGLLMNGTLSS